MALSNRQRAAQAPMQELYDVEVRPLPPELGAAALALWQYELDLRFSGNLHEAESEILAAMPILEGHENNFRHMIKILVDDIRQRPEVAPDNRFQIRLLNAPENLVTLLPEKHLSRIVVIPVSDTYSYHANARPEMADNLTWPIEALQGEHFTFISSPDNEAENSNPDDNFINLQQPLTPEQIAKYRIIARMIAQARVDVANQGLEAQVGLATALSAIRGAAARMLVNIRSYKKEIDKLLLTETTVAKNDRAPSVRESARAVRSSAVKLENMIKGQMGNSGLSAVMHQTLRAGLQQLQRIKTESGIKPRVQIVWHQRMDMSSAATSVQAKVQTSQTIGKAISSPLSKTAAVINTAPVTRSVLQKAVPSAMGSPKLALSVVKTVAVSTAIVALSAAIIGFKQAAERVQSRSASEYRLIRVVPLQATSFTNPDRKQTEPKTVQADAELKSDQQALEIKNLLSEKTMEVLLPPELAVGLSSAFKLDVKDASNPSQASDSITPVQPNSIVRLNPEPMLLITDHTPQPSQPIANDAQPALPQQSSKPEDILKIRPVDTTKPTFSAPEPPPHTKGFSKTDADKTGSKPAPSLTPEPAPKVTPEVISQRQSPPPDDPSADDKEILQTMKKAGEGIACRKKPGAKVCLCEEVTVGEDTSTQKQMAGLAARRKKGQSPNPV